MGAVNLSGNPLCAYKYYACGLIELLGLAMLDDREIGVEERERARKHMEELGHEDDAPRKRRNAFQSGPQEADLNRGELRIR